MDAVKLKFKRIKKIGSLYLNVEKIIIMFINELKRPKIKKYK